MGLGVLARGRRWEEILKVPEGYRTPFPTVSVSSHRSVFLLVSFDWYSFGVNSKLLYLRSLNLSHGFEKGVCSHTLASALSYRVLGLVLFVCASCQTWEK